MNPPNSVKIVFCIIVFVCSTNFLFAQIDSLNQLWAEFSEDETNLVELIEELSKDPVNINSDDRNEILRIPLIAEWQADSIMSFKKQHGNYRSKRQIRNIIGPDIYELVKEFITIHSVENYQGQIIHKSYYSFDPPPEISSGAYGGNVFYDLNKIYYSRSNIRTGIVTHKDPGEKNYLDFYTGYLSIKSGRFQLILGSYYFQFGEGLTFSNGFGQQKSSMVSLPFRSVRSCGFSSLSSAEETGLFGLYSKAELGPANVHLFYSNRNKDAQMTRDYQYITGLDIDGYHRTDAELYKKDQVKEVLYGAAVDYTLLSRLKIGGSISRLSFKPGLNFEPSIVGENEFRRQYFKFNGNTLNQVSFFYDLNWEPLNLRAEVSASDKGSPGIIQSVFFNREAFNFGIKYWYLSNNFQSPFGRIFDNSSASPQGEEGFYLSFDYKPFENVSTRAFKIFKKDLWRTYFSELPLDQDETLLEIESAFQKTNLIARLRIRDREEFADPDEITNPFRYQTRQYITRLQLDFEPDKSIRFRARWEYTELDQSTENGTSLFEDINYHFNKSFSISGRFVAYHTDSYNSRLYEYESDLPGSFANYAVYGEGYLWYGLIKWSLNKRFSIYLKYRYNLQKNSNLIQERILYPENELNRGLRFQIKILI